MSEARYCIVSGGNLCGCSDDLDSLIADVREWKAETPRWHYVAPWKRREALWYEPVILDTQSGTIPYQRVYP